MTMGCFFAAGRNSNAWHTFFNVQFDHHRGGVPVQLPAGILEDVKILGLHDVFQLAGYDPVLCLLVPHRFQEIFWSLYGGEDPPFFVYVLTAGLVYSVPPLRVDERSNMGSGIVVDISSHEVCFFQDNQSASMTSYEADRLEFGGASSSGGRLKVAVVDPPVLDDVELLVERNAE